jgi:hypothetical protein
MLWFTVWLVLVLLTVGGAVLLGRRLWRSGKALLAEIEAAGALTERLESLQDELRERYPEPTAPRPDIAAGPADRAKFHAMRHLHRQRSRRRRRAKLAMADRHWRSITWPPL